MTKSNGAILYEGPSLIDGSPIVAIVTGLASKSANPKTGDMLQTWILRTDVDPKAASENGQDSAICGTCPMRRNVETGKRRCYVPTWQAPLSVWKAYKRGAYAPIDTILEGRKLRLGSYGDPGAVPFEVWESALRGTVGHTGYTHAWKEKNADPRFATILMASVDFPWQAQYAEARRYRYFRVATPGDAPANNTRREIACPASKERGHVTDCATCLACSGTSNPKRQFNVVINEH